MVLRFPLVCILLMGGLALALMVPAWAATGISPEESAKRTRFAREYVKAVPPAQMMEQMVSTLTRRVSSKSRQEVVNILEEAMDMAAIEELTVSNLVKHYTAEELQAMANFYKTPVGQSIYRKTPEYTSDLFKELFPRIFQAYRQYQQEHQPRPESTPSEELEEDY